MTSFDTLLTEQIGHEFAASQQYIAIAVWFDDHDMPQLAANFYRQSIEERNHAMMLVQYRIDRDLGITIPGIPAVKNEFTDHREPIRLRVHFAYRVKANVIPERLQPRHFRHIEEQDAAAGTNDDPIEIRRLR
jgi:ferritin